VLNAIGQFLSSQFRDIGASFNHYLFTHLNSAERFSGGDRISRRYLTLGVA
jgi:hypothetical protein